MYHLIYLARTQNTCSFGENHQMQKQMDTKRSTNGRIQTSARHDKIPTRKEKKDRTPIRKTSGPL